MSQSEPISQFHETRSATRINLPKPTLRQWLLHLALFLVTVATTTICGIVMAGPDTGPTTPETSGFAGSLWLIPWYYVTAIVDLVKYSFANPALLRQGLIFSGSLLAILTSHESGHYFFCRYYGVDATLPFFIPQPPLLVPGTFGAFIRMKSPVPSRRALFDIGLAGPLAGFIVIIPVAVIGVLTLKNEPLPPGASGITFNDPLLFRVIASVLHRRLDDGLVNPYYLAAWFGALVTALNLMPVGQLDGGHGTFAVFGQKAHHWIGRGLFVGMVALAVYGGIKYGSPAWFLFLVLLLVMLRVRHPAPQQMEPLGPARIVVGVITLIVFVLCFLPVPFTIT
jgi:membrane-associated protease RseP (regulator of RpoE activity)